MLPRCSANSFGKQLQTAQKTHICVFVLVCELLNKIHDLDATKHLALPVQPQEHNMGGFAY